MKKRLSNITMLFVSAFAFSQQLPNRYVDDVFTTSAVTSGVIFSNNIPTVTTTNLFGNRIANEESYGQASVTLKMDIYSPTGDTNTNRPVIIFAFGGGFVNGSKTESSMIKLCQAYAKKGFVTATIDYRLGMNISNEELSKRAVYRALQDGRSAVRFFRKNAATYKIDPNKIFISGHSAGAFVALHNIYLDKDSERPASTRSYLGRADLGALDAIGDNKTYSNGTAVSGKANGAITFAGAVADVNYIENSSDVPAGLFHSSDDGTVPYNSGEPFSGLSWLPGFNLPTVYGSNNINTRAAAVSAKKQLYAYTNRGHNVHFTSGNLYSDIAPNGSTFLNTNLLKPSNVVISGPTSVCATCPAQTYSIPNVGSYYDWQIVGGTFVTRSTTSASVTVQWNNTTNRVLTVTPYSAQLSRGNTANLSVTLNAAPIVSNNINLSNSTQINLNDYFTDPEGENLEYSVKTLSGNINFIQDENSSNFVTITNLNEDLIIEATDGSNCKKTQVLAAKSITNLPYSVSASPNPFENELNISLTGNFSGKVDLKIYDYNGRIIVDKNVAVSELNNQINISNEIKNSGMYFLKVTTTLGQTSHIIFRK